MSDHFLLYGDGHHLEPDALTKLRKKSDAEFLKAISNVKPLTEKEYKSLMKKWKEQYGEKPKPSLWGRFVDWLMGDDFIP